MAGPGRQGGTPRRQLRPGWHHAPGRATRRYHSRHPGAADLSGRRGQRAPSPPLRGQQLLSAPARSRRPESGGAHQGRSAVRADRVAHRRAECAPLVHRLPIPPRVQFRAAYRTSAVQGFRRSRDRAPGEESRRCPGRSSCLCSMKLCGFEAGLDQPIFLIAGPCVIESRQLALDTAGMLKEICAELGMPFIYKSSYDKANRSSGKSFRGPGADDGLKILAEVKRQIGVPVLTDVHGIDQIEAAAAVVDVLQTPAFLCRQTDFINAVASAGKPVNIKKGQFLAPANMKNVVAKARQASGAENIMVCERGVSFGYNNLVSDMRSLAIMRDTGCPVVFD